MTERTIGNNRLIDGEKLDNLPADLDAELLLKEDKANKGIVNGYAELDGTGRVPASQLPPAASGGDMLASDYDSGLKQVNVYDQDNMDDGTVNKNYTATEQTKLAGIEAGAEVNQTDAEIKIQYEANADTNAFTDADESKLDGIAPGAEVNTLNDVIAGTNITIDKTDSLNPIISATSGGDVNGPASSTDNAITRFDLATGKVIQNSTVTLDDSGNVVGLGYDMANNTFTGTFAEFNAALSDGTFVSLTGTETLTNKTIDLTDNTLTGTLTEFNTAVSDDNLLGENTYDPQGIAGDAFDTDNHTDGVLNGVLSIQRRKAYDRMVPTGGTNGCLLAGIPTATTFDVSAGVYQIIDITDPADITITEIDYPGSTGTTDSFLSVSTFTWVFLSITGTILQQSTPPSATDFVDKYFIGVNGHFGAAGPTATFSVPSVGVRPPAFMNSLSLNREKYERGPVTITGNEFSFTTTAFIKAAGVGEKMGINFDNPKTPHEITMASGTFGVEPQSFYVQSSATPGEVLISPVTALDPTLKDDGDGTTTTVTANRWTNQYFYAYPGAPTLAVVYGREIYNNCADALAGIGTEMKTTHPILDEGLLLGCITARGGTTDYTIPADATFVPLLRLYGTINVGGGGASTGSQDIQETYELSIQPQLTTNITLGANQIKGGTGTDTDNNSEWLNNAGTTTASIDGNGLGVFNELSVANGLDMNASAISDVLDPVLAQDGATKNYVDLLIQNVSRKDPVTVATTGNITLSGEQTIDGILTSDNRVLVWQQTDQTENGIYVSSTGAWSRSTDSNTGDEVLGSHVSPLVGTTYASRPFVNANASIIIGATNIVYIVQANAQLHNELGSTQGGITNEYYHLTNQQHTDVTSVSTAEYGQLANINATTISATQWGYVGAMNQGVATTDNVTFGNLTATGSVSGEIRPTSGSFSSGVAQLYTTAADGLTVTGATGSVTDLLFTNGIGQTVLENATGTQNLELSGSFGIGIAPTSKLTVFGTGVGNATVQIEGEGGADPYINFLTNNTTHWSTGVDDSDSDKYKISQHSTLGTNNYLTINVGGGIGIGTTTPSAKVEIQEALEAEALRIDVDTANRARGSFSVFEDYFKIQTSGQGTSAGHLALNPSGNNVGIGTTTPAVDLQIKDANVPIGEETSLHIYGSATNGSAGDISTEIAFKGDTGGGWGGAFIRTVRNPATQNTEDALTFGTSTAGAAPVERMRITDLGDIGIGTNTPKGKFDIFGNTQTIITAGYGLASDNIHSYHTAGQNANNNGFIKGYGFKVTTTASATDDAKFHIGYNTTFNTTSEYPTSLTDVMTFDKDNVGIGTTTPGEKLSINGALSVDGFSDSTNNYISLRAGSIPSSVGGSGIKATDHSGSSDDGLAIYGHDGVSIFSAQVERMRFTSTGNVGINTITPTSGAKLDVNGRIMFDGNNAAGPGLAFRGDPDTGLFTPTANALSVSTGGSERMRVTTGGVFMYNLKSGANQGAAGAAVNELWRDTADQTIKIGV